MLVRDGAGPCGQLAAMQVAVPQAAVVMAALSVTRTRRRRLPGLRPAGPTSPSVQRASLLQHAQYKYWILLYVPRVTLQTLPLTSQASHGDCWPWKSHACRIFSERLYNGCQDGDNSSPVKASSECSTGEHARMQRAWSSSA